MYYYVSFSAFFVQGRSLVRVESTRFSGFGMEEMELMMNALRTELGEGEREKHSTQINGRLLRFVSYSGENSGAVKCRVIEIGA